MSRVCITPAPGVQVDSIRVPSRTYSRKGSNMTARQVEEDREKYSFRHPAVRPLSAPHRDTYNRRLATRSAKARMKYGTPSFVEADESGDMFAVVKAAKEAKTFKQDAEFYRTIERSMQERENDSEEKKDTAPVFNKRLFASQGAVIITGEARRLMERNSEANVRCDLVSNLTKTEVQCLRCVVDGLKLIHKRQDFVKDVLSKVISYEVYKPFEYVPTKHWEEHLSCYYILNGAVEVTYDLRSRESRHVFQANILYSHGTGEYLGLVSPEGPREDLSPPATIYTKELTQFIRVDRERFHKLTKNATEMIDEKKRNFISSHSFLAAVSLEVKDKILHKLSIQEYTANRVLLAQGEITEYIYIIMKGRCQTYREVHIPEAGREVLFYLTSRDEDDFFGEECVLDQSPSLCTVVTATAITCLKLHRSALKMVNRDKLSRFIDERRHEIPSDINLRDRGYHDSMWNRFKHTQVKATLKEGGNMRYLSRPKSAAVRERPLAENEVLVENMRRFVMKGSQFEPVRAQSAVPSSTNRHRGMPRRPRTAFAGLVTETTEQLTDDDENENKENANDAVDAVAVSNNTPEGEGHSGSKLLTTEKARNMSHMVEQAMESKESLLKVLDEQSDVGSQLRQAWNSENTQETQNFMKNGVLVTMTSEDIVRKAKAMADTNVDKLNKNDMGVEEEWDTILHAENKQAKMLITANRLRMKDLKRRLAELQKKREREKRRNAPRKADDSSDSEDDKKN